MVLKCAEEKTWKRRKWLDNNTLIFLFLKINSSAWQIFTSHTSVG
jgi:hypothetical protein